MYAIWNLGTYTFNVTEIPVNDCDFHRELLKTRATKYTPRNSSSGLKDILTMEYDENDVVTVMLHETVNICGAKAFVTSTDGLFIILDDSKLPGTIRNFTTMEVDTNLNRESYIQSLILKLSLGLYQDLKKIQFEICSVREGFISIESWSIRILKDKIKSYFSL